jgi:hypothetical protein
MVCFLNISFGFVFVMIYGACKMEFEIPQRHILHREG